MDQKKVSLSYRGNDRNLWLKDTNQRTRHLPLAKICVLEVLRKSEAAVHLRHAAATPTMDLKDSANVQTQSYMHIGNWTQDITKPPALVSHILYLYSNQNPTCWLKALGKGAQRIYGYTALRILKVCLTVWVWSICMDWLANLQRLEQSEVFPAAGQCWLLPLGSWDRSVFSSACDANLNDIAWMCLDTSFIVGSLRSKIARSHCNMPENSKRAISSWIVRVS